MKKIFLFFALMGIISISCIQENENLVNPPSKAETVLIRYLNLSGDKENRSMVFEGMYETPSIPYSSSSQAVNPPADSSFLEVKKGGAVEFRQQALVKYIRNSVYTFISLPSIDTASQQRPVDTIVYFRTTAAVDKYSTNAYVKFFNGINNADLSFSLKLGCPNGDPIKSSARYLERMTQPVSVRSGKVAFSLVKNSPEPDIVNLYEVDLEPRKQYLFVALEDNSGEYNLLVIEEESVEPDAVYFAKIVSARNTFVRAVNYTNKNVSLRRESLDLFSDLQPEYITDYSEIEVCMGADKDTIETYLSGEFKALNSLSLDVLENYTIFTFDSSGTDDLYNIISEPIVLDKEVDGKTLIRTVNGASNYEGLTLSIGARTDTSNTGFSSGINLANRLGFAEISNVQIVEPGILPLVVFTATAPAYLLYSTKIEVEPDKSYIVVLSDSETEPVNVSVIEEEDTEKNVNYKELGVYSQVVNALYDKDSLFVGINPPMLDHGRLGSSGSLATVLDEGMQDISLNGNTISVNAEKNKRVLTVAYGNVNDLKTYVINSDPMGANSHNFYWRFVNVSNVAEIGVKEDVNDEINLINILQYSDTPPEAIDKEKKRALYFYDNSTGEELYRLSDVQLNFGKNYTIIFTGDSPQNYNTIIQQEF